MADALGPVDRRERVLSENDDLLLAQFCLFLFRFFFSFFSFFDSRRSRRIFGRFDCLFFFLCLFCLLLLF